MNRYKVITGTHIQNGKAYTKGQVVESSVDLAALFREKFEALGPAPISPAGQPPAESPPAPSKASVAAAPAGKKGKAKRSGSKATEDWDDDK